MSYRFIYSNIDRARLITAVVIDARSSISAISGKVGSVIKAYADEQVGLVDEPRFLTYKIETNEGSVAGYFVISVRSSGTSIVEQVLRPAFEPESSVISGEIANFITSGNWKADALL